MNHDDFGKEDINKILTRLNSLEERIALLESNKDRIRNIQIPRQQEIEETDLYVNDKNVESSSLFETNLGEYGLAWLGTMVLFFAIAFLGQYFINAGKPIVYLIIGIISVFACFAISHFSRKNFIYLSFTFNLFGYIILYYFILRLHYYNLNPIIANELVAIFLMLVLVGVQLYYSIRKHSQTLAGWALTLAVITSFVSNNTQQFFLISILTTGLSLYLFWKYGWWKALIFILSITYLSFLIWMFKNHALLAKNPEDINHYFIFIYFSITTAIYSLVVFKKPNDLYNSGLILSIILLAGIAYSVLLLLLVFMYFSTAYVLFFLAISIYCLAYSIILKFYSPYKYSPALYALFGFVGISIAIWGIYQFPNAFLLLICQSFLVLLLSLWYRSQTITLINTVLFLILISVYYKISGELQAVNFAIPTVAFLSARIINWQKERLNIKTDFIRNLYLLILFFSLLYATYKGLPGHYITISWIVITGIYFGLSILLKNIKYRWMAVANLLVSALYLFIVDLAKTGMIYRILAFLVFAIVSISISVYYVKKLKKKNTDNY